MAPWSGAASSDLEGMGENTRAPAAAWEAIPRWLPNAITMFRVALIPAFLVLAAACQAAAREGGPEGAYRAAAVAVLCVIGASDLLDGYVARRHGLSSQLGAVLDAAADKLTQVSFLLFFAVVRGPAFPAVPLWFPFLVMGRDVILAAGALALRMRGFVQVEHREHGKLATTLMFLLLVWITSGLPARGLSEALWLAAGVVIASTASYVWTGVARLRALARE